MRDQIARTELRLLVVVSGLMIYGGFALAAAA